MDFQNFFGKDIQFPQHPSFVVKLFTLEDEWNEELKETEFDLNISDFKPIGYSLYQKIHKNCECNSLFTFFISNYHKLHIQIFVNLKMIIQSNIYKLLNYLPHKVSLEIKTWKIHESHRTMRCWKHSENMVEINVNKDVFMHHERVLNVIFDGFLVEWNV